MLRGLDDKQTLLLPDEDAKKAVALKREDPEKYAETMERQAASMRQRAEQDS